MLAYSFYIRILVARSHMAAGKDFWPASATRSRGGTTRARGAARTSSAEGSARARGQTAGAALRTRVGPPPRTRVRPRAPSRASEARLPSAPPRVPRRNVQPQHRRLCAHWLTIKSSLLIVLLLNFTCTRLRLTLGNFLLVILILNLKARLLNFVLTRMCKFYFV